MCELLHTSLVVQKMQGDMELAIIYPGQSVLSFFASRSFFLIGELLLGKLSETVVVQGNAPHDRPCGLVGHLIGNCASFLCTKAPMVRVPETNFLHGIRSYWARCSGDLPPSPPPADERPLWLPCHALVPRHDRNGLARNHREQQKESQLRDIERIRNKKAELRRKAEVCRCQGAGERGQDANSAAVMHRHHDRRQ